MQRSEKFVTRCIAFTAEKSGRVSSFCQSEEKKLDSSKELKHQETIRRLPHEEKLRFYARLVEAEGLERFIHTKHVGTKRFGIDGGKLYRVY